MKIILSKKGFDSTYGGGQSPVFINKEGKEEFISMPIPAIIFKKDRPEPEENKDLPEPEFDKKNTCDNVKYSDIIYHGRNLGKLIEKLKDKTEINPNPITNAKKQANKNRSLKENSLCHFDPQLVPSKKDETNKNWKPLFGQAGKAQGHLANPENKVEKNALFLFFGQFRLIDEPKKDGKTFTAIYGWLQVEECIDLKNISEEDKAKIKKEKPYIAEHPHFYWDPISENNTIYTATDLLKIGQSNPNIKGAGLFDRLYILTEEKEGAETNAKDRKLEEFNFKSITNWILPICLSPDNNVTLTHNDTVTKKGKEKNNWKKNENDENTCKLEAPKGYGQEFVLNYDKATDKIKGDIETWVKNLFA